MSKLAIKAPSSQQVAQRHAALVAELEQAREALTCLSAAGAAAHVDSGQPPAEFLPALPRVQERKRCSMATQRSPRRPSIVSSASRSRPKRPSSPKRSRRSQRSGSEYRSRQTRSPVGRSRIARRRTRGIPQSSARLASRAPERGAPGSGDREGNRSRTSVERSCNANAAGSCSTGSGFRPKGSRARSSPAQSRRHALRNVPTRLFPERTSPMDQDSPTTGMTLAEATGAVEHEWHSRRVSSAQRRRSPSSPGGTTCAPTEPFPTRTIPSSRTAFSVGSAVGAGVSTVLVVFSVTAPGRATLHRGVD